MISTLRANLIKLFCPQFTDSRNKLGRFVPGKLYQPSLTNTGLLRKIVDYDKKVL